MTITNEIKAKVFAQYLGHPMKCTGGHFIANKNSMRDGVKIMSLSVMADCYEGTFKWSDFKLILTPLSQISDEDEIELGNIIGTFDVTYFIRSLIGKTVYSINASTAFQCYQFLQSNGYDLPQYLLGGKTLHECGLAIYESDNTEKP